MVVLDKARSMRARLSSERSWRKSAARKRFSKFGPSNDGLIGTARPRRWEALPALTDEAAPLTYFPMTPAAAATPLLPDRERLTAISV